MRSMKNGKASIYGGASAAALAASLMCMAPAAYAQEQMAHFSVPAQPLASALLVFGRQAHISIAAPHEIVDGRASVAVEGDLTARDALKRLLSGSGLSFQFVSPSAVRVMSSPADSSGGNGPEKATAVQEVVVTAEKRNERMQDAPVPVSTVDPQALIDNGQTSLSQYYKTVPGLSFTVGNRNEPNLSIRGLTTGVYTNPTVGIVIDDIPYGSATALGGGYAVPDLDPGDLSDIEILRGPQGTLYGASTLGGLVKFTTIDPSTAGVSGRLEAGVSSVYDGHDAGYQLRGSVNLPVTDDLAVRASAFTREDPGYIDNVETHQRGVNQVDADGARLSALWRPNDQFSLKLSALIQSVDRKGSPDVDILPGLSGMEQTGLLGTGVYDKRIQSYSAVAKWNLGGATITSLTGYSINNSYAAIDYTPFFSAASLNQFGVSGTPLTERDHTSGLTQEIRLSSPTDQHIEWMLGGFYTRQLSLVDSNLLATDPQTGAVAGTWFINRYPTMYQEYAVFGDVTVHFTPRFDVQLGARESENRQSYWQSISGPYVTQFLGVPSPTIQPLVRTEENSFTYLVTPRFKISPDVMIYARVASGYRPGGPNGGCLVFQVPCHFNPDTTQDYDLGLKGDFLDKRLTLDTSLYYIDWHDIQIQAYAPGFNGYVTNGARAKSEGLEISLTGRPTDSLTLSGYANFNDAELTAPFPANSTVIGVPGDRLPYASRFSGNIDAKQEFPLGDLATGYVGGMVSYVGERQSELGGAVRQSLPAYTEVDLRVGAMRDAWRLNVYLNNVANTRGVLQGGIGHFPSYGFDYIQPRTIGMTLSRKF